MGEGPVERIAHQPGEPHQQIPIKGIRARRVCNPRGYARSGVNENPLFDPDLTIELHEILGDAAQESSNAWNNAGTGHAALCELNYTPEKREQVIVDFTVAIGGTVPPPSGVFAGTDWLAASSGVVAAGEPGGGATSGGGE